MGDTISDENNLKGMMVATVEIATGRRRILEYLFSPVAEISYEAMHGR